MIPMTLLVASVLGAGADLEGVVLDFTSRGCGPCQQLSPMVSRLERLGYPIRKIDCESNRDLVEKFNVKFIPAFILVIDGVERERLGGGSVSEEDLKRLCARIPRKNADSDSTARQSEAEQNPKSRSDGQNAGSTTAGAPQANPEKSGGKFPFLSVKRDDASPRDLREGAVSRGKADEPVKGRAAVQGNPLAASVRIRIKDDRQSDSVGSGTIIDSRVGKTTILTCGHIFRNRDFRNREGQAVIEVDCYFGGREQTVIGRRLFHDLDSDVGLITINADSLASCRVAGVGTKIVKGAPVVTVGCSAGDKPSVERAKITALNRNLGADNIEVGRMPVEGRSGGGLFTQDGELIGVCSGADPKYKEGFYAGLQSVHDLLDHCHLTYLYNSGSAGELQAPPSGTDLVDAGAGEPSSTSSEDAKLGAAGPRKPAGSRSPKQVQAGRNLVAASEEAANASDENSIREALEQAGEAEIVCIIRPINKPGAPTRVVILNRASRRFVEYLSDEEMDDRPEIRETTLTTDDEKPRQRKAMSTQKVKRPATVALDDASSSAGGDAGHDSDKSSAPQAYRRRPASRLSGE